MSWPTSYFMQKYGQYWLRTHGYDLSLSQIQKVIILAVGFVGFLGRVSFLASVDFSQIMASRLLYRQVSSRLGTVAFWMETTGTTRLRYRDVVLSAADGFPGGARYPTSPAFYSGGLARARESWLS